MTVKFTNNASSTLASGINSSVTSLTVASASTFPSLAGANDYCYLTLQESGGTTREIVKATALSSNTFTIVRGQDNTSAAAWSSGDLVELRITSALLQDVIDGLGSGSMMDTDIFAGDGSDTTFTLSRQPDDENHLLVFIDGVFQAHNAYSISGTTLTLSAAPATGRVITAYHMATTVGGSNLTKATMTGDNSDVTLDVGSQILHENNVQVFFDGVYQSKSNYSVSGSVITFSTAPPTGVAVEAILNTATNISTAAQLIDADNDTKISVEESADEDTIRMDIAGTEVLTLTNSAMTLKGTTPTLTIGDAGAEDTKIVFDGNAQDFYIGLDDSADDLIIGKGSTVGTTPAVIVDENLNVGIGVAATRGPLHVHNTTDNADSNIHLTSNETGSASTDGFTISVSPGGADDGTVALIQRENASMKFYTNGTSRLEISNAGTATFQHPIVTQSGATQGYYIENNAGNATTPRITNDANDHTVIRPGKSGGAVQWNNFANDAELMRLDDSGRLGIGGQASPAAKLDIKGDTSTYGGMSKIYLTDTSSNAARRNWAIGNGGSGYGNFTIGVSNAADGDPMASGTHITPLVIDNTGNVGIGDIAPDNKLQISDSSVGTDATANDSNYIKLTNKDAGTQNEVWGLGFSTESSGTDYLGAYVHALGDYASNFNTSLVFGTRPTSSGAAIERMRIASSGFVSMGNTAADTLNSASGYADLAVGDGSGNCGISIYTGTNHGGGIAFADGTSGDASYRGLIEYAHNSDQMNFRTAAADRMSLNSSRLHINANVSFSASATDANRYTVYWNSSTGGLIVVSSDQRLKKDFDYELSGIETIKKLKPVRFTWKESEKRQLGFVAQEAITADEHLAWNDTENDQWGLDGWEGYVAMLTKAIQEQQALIETLQTKVKALEEA